jgi:hypothetical protein
VSEAIQEGEKYNILERIKRSITMNLGSDGWSVGPFAGQVGKRHLYLKIAQEQIH